MIRVIKAIGLNKQECFLLGYGEPHLQGVIELTREELEDLFTNIEEVRK